MVDFAYMRTDQKVVQSAISTIHKIEHILKTESRAKKNSRTKKFIVRSVSNFSVNLTTFEQLFFMVGEI